MKYCPRILLSFTSCMLLACDVPDEPMTDADLDEAPPDLATPNDPPQVLDAEADALAAPEADPEAGLLCLLCVLAGNTPSCGADGLSHPNACFANCEGGGAVAAGNYWPDDDADGFGDASAAPISACAAPAGTVDNQDDCDDADDAAFPGHPEDCDGVDNDCEPASACDPANCADIRLEDPAADDGEYTLHVGQDPAKPWTVYCHDMAGTPQDFLTLPNPGNNYSAHALIGDGTEVYTYYTRVRIDPATLLVDVDDRTFADSIGSIDHAGTTVTAMPYAVLESCGTLQYILKGPQARVDLSGTPLRFASPVCVGTTPTEESPFYENNQIATVTPNNLPASCGWKSIGCITDPHQSSNGSVLALAYIDP